VALGGKVSAPAMDVMDLGRTLAVVEPGGTTTFFWQPKSHLGSRIFLRPGSLMWCDLDTNEPEKAARFFRELLGWRVSKDPEAPGLYWQVSVDDEMQAGIMRRPEWLPADAPPRWLIYLGTADLGAAVQLTEKLGGRAEMEPIVVPEMVAFCVLSDPAGATFAVMQTLAGAGA
jgi:predicted enzyme related to lactoylglutathione lyase